MSTQDNIVEDLLYSSLPIFKKQIAKARENISRCLSIAKKPVVSFSGGKDSCVMLDLVLEQAPDTDVVFYDSGAEFPETYEVIDKACERYNKAIKIIEPEWNMIDLIKYKYQEGGDPDFKYELVLKPSSFAAEKFGYDMFFVGLRKEESKGRFFALTRMNDCFYWNKERRYYLAYPLRHVSSESVFAYMRAHGLPAHPIYDDERIRVPRFERRVSAWAGDVQSRHGRYMWLKITHPDIYEKLISLIEEAKYLI